MKSLCRNHSLLLLPFESNVIRIFSIHSSIFVMLNLKMPFGNNSSSSAMEHGVKSLSTFNILTNFYGSMTTHHPSNQNWGNGFDNAFLGKIEGLSMKSERVLNFIKTYIYVKNQYQRNKIPLKSEN